MSMSAQPLSYCAEEQDRDMASSTHLARYLAERAFVDPTGTILIIIGSVQLRLLQRLVDDYIGVLEDEMQAYEDAFSGVKALLDTHLAQTWWVGYC